uniref:Uncharacterized protein n=1 Tax=Anguilla anguilla TaxID=7936 RepID=A0A0E9TCE8_ANGAN
MSNFYELRAVLTANSSQSLRSLCCIWY